MESSKPIPGVCDMVLPFGVKSSYSPSVIVFTMTVGFYYLNGIWNSHPKDSWWVLTMFMFILFALIQGWVINYQSITFNKCPPAIWKGIVFAMVFGIICGTVSYWVAIALNKGSMSLIQRFTNYKENFSDSSGFNGIAFPGGSPSELAAAAKAKAVGEPTTGITGQCLQKSADSDEYVCDVYKNGQLVTKTITE